MTDGTAEVWLFNGLVLAVIAVSNVVVQSMGLHFALARAQREPGELAGLPFILTCVGVTGIWILAGVLLSRLWIPAACTGGDVGALWLGVLYGGTIWPAWRQARRVNGQLPGWYWVVQGVLSLILVALGGFPCLFAG